MTQRWLAVTLLMAGATSLVAVMPAAVADFSPPFSVADLPDIGEPADQSMSPADERRIGAEVMGQLYRYQIIDEDPELQDYLVKIGQRLLAASNAPETDIRIFTVADGRINAFALPGGYIGMNRGLLMAAETESEMAGVLAHEIAHVTQRHIARTQEGTGVASLATWAAVLLAIIAGGGDSDVVLGALSAGGALNAQRQINYTRSHELEADRLGIQTMSAAGFNPDGVVNFFSTLEQQTRLYGAGVPEILRTHPLNTRRIAEARSSAAKMPGVENEDNAEFELMRARARVLSQSRPSEALEYYGQLVRKGDASLASHYGLSLALVRVGQPEEALAALAPLIESQPRNLNVLLAQAEAQRAARQIKAAFATYERAVTLYPRSGAATLEYASWLIDQGEPVEARRLLLRHDQALELHVQGLRLLADAATLTGDKAEAAYQMGNYHFARGDAGTALSHLDAGLRIDDLNEREQARLTARRNEVRESLPRNWTPEYERTRRVGAAHHRTQP
ncbi:M48 family metalloprotease [Polycyclovorans algicola]|uniref:M48 family metalloprotease n=1 Tax=Polycyclovorans algicola TaxID=616992 RepID=UPI0004A6A951|nr:M48 family metalloprotease [Polycyclovorans algicola]